MPESPMNKTAVTGGKSIPIRQMARRLGTAVANFLTSPVGGRARWMLLLLLALMLGINAMNVANSYVGRWFMSAIEARDTAGFARFAWLYAGVFLAATALATLFRFIEERLGLLWREWLTRRITGAYITRRIFLEEDGNGNSLSNPDQRMTEDVRQFTATTLSFLLMVLNGTMAVLSFSGVLWAISPRLFGVAVLYALAGSAITILLGRPLVRLNYRQSDYEADFRSALIHTREEGTAIAASGREPEVKAGLDERINALVGNLRRIIAVNRNLNFFTSGYNYFIQLIPVLLVAPMFMDGRVEFGVIGQSAMAFATLLGAFSLVITQFQAISNYATVITRLSEFVEHAENMGRKDRQASS
jgi:putative ATP-binding cassette transporter